MFTIFPTHKPCFKVTHHRCSKSEKEMVNMTQKKRKLKNPNIL